MESGAGFPAAEKSLYERERPTTPKLRGNPETAATTPPIR